MSPPRPPEQVGPGTAPAEEDAEIAAVLEGRDRIELASDLVAELPPPERQESLATRIRSLPVAARVKLALTGNKEARRILAGDPVKVVQTCVLKNPRVTLDEALAMAKNRSLHGEILRSIADEREWVRHYPLRLALVQNPKTPLQIALALLGGLHERDVRLLARSKNVASVLQQQARRKLLRKDGK